MRCHSRNSRGARLASRFILIQGGARRYSETRAVGVPARAQPAACRGVDFGGHRQADLALGEVAFRRGSALSVCLDVLLANRLLLQQVADLHDVSDDLHGARQRLLPWGEILFNLLQVGGRGPALFP